VIVVVSDEIPTRWRRDQGVGGSTRPPAREGKLLGEVEVDEEVPGTAAELGEAPVDAELPRAPAASSSRFELLRRGGVKLTGGEGSVRRGEQVV
jgi:hypothetical protein